MLWPDHEQFARVLDRVLAWTKDGISHEVDQRHAELIVQQLKFAEAKAVVIPGTREEQSGPSDVKLYRMLIARSNCLAMDRPDIQYAIKEVAKCTSNPKCTIGKC